MWYKCVMSMNYYEIQLLLNHAASQDQCTAVMDSVEKYITGKNGKIITKTLDDLQVLKYKINKNNVARYAYVSFEMDTNEILALKKMMGLNSDIIRYIVVKADKAEDLKKASFLIVNEKDYKNRSQDYWKDSIRYSNPNVLRIFTTERGKILSRKLVEGITRTKTSIMMRTLKKEIKKARTMAWLPL